MISQRVLSLLFAGAVGAVAAVAPHGAHAQALPTPLQLVSSLDLECYKTPGPDLNRNLMLTHLNRVLVDLGLPQHQVKVREQVQTCVPVRKGNTLPDPAAALFVRQIDLACFRLEADPLPAPVQINLTHLNPVLIDRGLPPHHVWLKQPAQLCVPVAKNGQLPNEQIQQLIRYIDLECWNVDPEPYPSFSLLLTQLNPQLVNAIPPHPMTLVQSPRQLCVPVRKGNQDIPVPVRPLVRWIDLEKFAADPDVTIPKVKVVLSHLNPLFADLPAWEVWLEVANSLMVPVDKNNSIPGGGGGD